MLELSNAQTKPIQVRPNILVYFRDSTSRSLFKKLLDRIGLVTDVSSAEEMLKSLSHDIYDVVILGNGLETLKSARAKDAEVPIIVVSLLADQGEIVKCLQHGANDYIAWPFDADIIRARVSCQIDLKQRLNEQRHALKQMKQASDTKDRFLRIASHDLKNPLNNIRLAQYYLRRLVGDNPQAVEALDTVEMALNLMNQLIMDFLDSAALESGKTELTLENVVLEEVIWDVMSRYSGTASAKNITLLMGETEGIALADRGRLVQILSNLVSNAIKYSPRERFVTLSSVAKGDNVRFMVTDEGPGIPESERSGLFEPFAQVSTKPTAGENSTGLGLWIVKELVDLHGGRVGVECPPTGGSTFWVDLPAVKQASAEAIA
jgi:signal transduction histidine kinase